MLILRRVLRLVFVFFVVTFVTFVLLDMTPGDPAATFAGLNATPEVVEPASRSACRCNRQRYGDADRDQLGQHHQFQRFGQ
jgi:ABC-type dipeptide/oligopeptide/nickel transport system permease component